MKSRVTIAKRNLARGRRLIREQWRPFLHITLGCALMALAIQLFVVPARLPGAGVTGIAILLNYLWGINLSISIWALNIGLFLYGWKVLPRPFLIWSIYGTAVLTAFIEIFKTLPVPAIDDRFLLIVAAGLIQGLGTAMTFSAGGSTGGLDIVTMAVRRRTGMEVSKFTFIANAVIIVSFLLAVSYENVLYGLVLSYITSTVMAGAMRSFEIRHEALIITRYPEKVRTFITGKLNRGVTIFYGRGGYSDQNREILLTLLSPRQVMLLKQHLLDLDPRAFMIMSQATEVVGRGFKPWKKSI